MRNEILQVIPPEEQRSITSSDRHLFLQEARGGPIIDKDALIEGVEETKHDLIELYKEAGLPKCTRAEKVAAFEATIFEGNVQRQLTAATFMENLSK